MKFQDLDDKQKIAVITGVAVLTLAAAIFLLSQTWLKSIKKTKSQLSTIEMNILAVKRAQEDIIKFETD
ncbi:MAG: hypothetical protein V1653_04605, partial [bacterium]